MRACSPLTQPSPRPFCLRIEAYFSLSTCPQFSDTVACVPGPRLANLIRFYIVIDGLWLCLLPPTVFIVLIHLIFVGQLPTHYKLFPFIEWVDVFLWVNPHCSLGASSWCLGETLSV